MAIGDVGLAEEAIDEAMTRALAHWHEVGRYDRPEGWLFRVGLNWARGVFRKRRYELLSDLTRSSHSSADPLPDPDLIEALGRLSLKHRVSRWLDLRPHPRGHTARVGTSLGQWNTWAQCRLPRTRRRRGLQPVGRGVGIPRRVTDLVRGLSQTRNPRGRRRHHQPRRQRQRGHIDRTPNLPDRNQRSGRDTGQLRIHPRRGWAPSHGR